MPCTEGLGALLRWGATLVALSVAGCANLPSPPSSPSPSAAAAAASPGPVAPQQSISHAEPAHAGHAADGTRAAGPAVAAAPTAATAKAPPRYVKLGPPKTPHNWDEFRLQAAQRLVAAHPDTTYVGTPPSILLAIPILEIELHADGSVRHIKVLRVPGAAEDTTELAIEAVRRAAPYGDVSRLKKPWKFVETFLFDDDRRFMPRTLDR